MDWLDKGPFTFFDIETTGMSPSKDRIVEIGAIRVERNGKESRFSSLINPGVKVSPEAISVHGIDNQMLSGAPRFASVAKRFIDFASGSTLVAHNAIFVL